MFRSAAVKAAACSLEVLDRGRRICAVAEPPGRALHAEHGHQPVAGVQDRYGNGVEFGLAFAAGLRPIRAPGPRATSACQPGCGR